MLLSHGKLKLEQRAILVSHILMAVTFSSPTKQFLSTSLSKMYSLSFTLLVVLGQHLCLVDMLSAFDLIP
jgi:hypothetical protein